MKVARKSINVKKVNTRREGTTKLHRFATSLERQACRLRIRTGYDKTIRKTVEERKKFNIEKKKYLNALRAERKKQVQACNLGGK